MKSLQLNIMFIFLVGNACAQQKEDSMSTTFGELTRVTIENNIAENLGTNIKNIGYYFINGELSDVIVRFEKPIEDLNFGANEEFLIRNKGFEMTNEADIVLLNEQFPNIKSPPKPTMTSANYLGDVDTSKNYNIYAIERYRDSTIYTFSTGLEMKHSFYFLTKAYFRGNVEEFKNDIKSSMLVTKPVEIIDSIVILEGIISKDGNFENPSLIYGGKSSFSELLLQKLRKTKWRPAFLSSTGAKWRVKIRIYVRLNEDGDITIVYPNKIYNSTGS